MEQVHDVALRNEPWQVRHGRRTVRHERDPHAVDGDRAR